MPYQIVYVSSSRDTVDASQLSAILDVSRRNNARDGISGLLIYHDRMFFQVLEGDRTAVEQCYARIAKDPRHDGATAIWENDEDERTFAHWAMGHARPEDLDTDARDAVHSLADMRSGGGTFLKGDTAVADLVRSVLADFRGLG